MFRPIVAITAACVAAAPAAAANYSARPATPAANRIVARDIVWTCDAAACQGVTADSRPTVLCQALAKRAGRIESFLVDGRAFSAAELERCNASAKTQPVPALAAN